MLSLLVTALFKLDIGKEFFTVRMAKHWEVVNVLSLEMVKASFEYSGLWASWSSLRCFCLLQGSSTGWHLNAPSIYDSMILSFMLHHNSGYKNIPLYSTKSMPPFANDTTNNAGPQGSSGRILVAAKEKLTQEMRHWLLQAEASSSLPLLQRRDFFKVHSKASGRSQHQISTWRAAFSYHWSKSSARRRRNSTATKTTLSPCLIKLRTEETNKAGEKAGRHVLGRRAGDLGFV